jgi:hypothetical protein
MSPKWVVLLLILGVLSACATLDRWDAGADRQTDGGRPVDAGPDDAGREMAWKTLGTPERTPEMLRRGPTESGVPDGSPAGPQAIQQRLADLQWLLSDMLTTPQ